MTSCRLFIGGISWETSEDSFREYFKRFGDVLEAVIMTDRDTGRGRGFGFIVFADCNVADRVVRLKHMINGKSVEAKIAVPKDDHMILTKSNSSFQGSPGPANTRKIFVGGLPASVTEAGFKKYFSQFGTIMDIVVMYDHKTQRPRGFGFITYDSEEAVDLVLQRKYHELDGKMVEVKLAVPKETSPNQNRTLMRSNSFESNMISTLLNDYNTQGYNLSPMSSYGGRYSPAADIRGSFSPFRHRYGIDLDFLVNQDQSSGYNGSFGRPFSPGCNDSLSRYVPYPSQWDGYVTEKQLCGKSRVGIIGEKWGSFSEGRSYCDYINEALESVGGSNNFSSFGWTNVIEYE